MNKFTRHIIFRQYLAIIRRETFQPSEIGEEKDGEIVSQLNWQEDESLSDTVLNLYGLQPAEIFALGIIQKPTNLVNRIVCSEIKRRHGEIVLRRAPSFDAQGDFILPRENGFLMPSKEGNLITGFEFYRDLKTIFETPKRLAA